MKCRPIRFAKERYQSCLKVITDFCVLFESDFPLTFRWVGLKPIGHPAIELFNKGVGFSWRAYKNLGISYTCAGSTISPFVDTIGSELTGFDERGITNLAATNTGSLPYLADEGVRFMHYSADNVKR